MREMEIEDASPNGDSAAEPQQNSDTQVDELIEVAQAGLKLGLERWHEVCPCCFSEAYPKGLGQALRELGG